MGCYYSLDEMDQAETLEALKMSSKGNVFKRISLEDAKHKINASYKQSPPFGSKGIRSRKALQIQENMPSSSSDDDDDCEANLEEGEAAMSLNSSLNLSLTDILRESIEIKVSNSMTKKKKDFENKEIELQIYSLLKENALIEKVRQKNSQFEAEEREFERLYVAELEEKQKRLKETHILHAQMLDRKQLEAKSEALRRDAARKKEQEQLAEKVRREIDEVEKTEQFLAMLVSRRELFEKLPPSIKCGPDIMKQITNKISSLSNKQELVPEDVSMASALSSEARKIATLFHTHIAELAKLEANKENRSSVGIHNSPPKVSEDLPSSETPKAVDPVIQKLHSKNSQEYVRLLELYYKCESQCKDLTENPEYKPYKHKLMRVIYENLNRFNDFNPRMLDDTLSKLCRLFKGDDVEILGGEERVSIRKHPSAATFCFIKLAVKLVAQTEQLVTVESIQGLATLAAGVCSQHPNFRDLLIAHLAFKCPFIIPYYGSRDNKTEIEYYQFLGYKISNKGELEKQDLYLRRIYCLTNFFASFVISKPPRLFFGQPTQERYSDGPFDLKQTWGWLAEILAQPPLSGVTATVLRSFLTFVGENMKIHYGLQFTKLLKFIQVVYLLKIRAVTGVTEQKTVADLVDLLGNALASGKIAKPSAAF